MKGEFILYNTLCLNYKNPKTNVTLDIGGVTLHRRSCSKNMTSYVGKCFDHVSAEDDKHSRSCFCDTDKCNESSETLLLPDEETEVIYNISSSMKE